MMPLVLQIRFAISFKCTLIWPISSSPILGNRYEKFPRSYANAAFVMISNLFLTWCPIQ
jgi:hypothetical protein